MASFRESGIGPGRGEARRMLSLLLSLLFSALLLFGCKGIQITGKTEDVPGFTEAQAMVLLGSERNRYQNVFGPELWSLPISGQQEENYGEYFTARMKEFLQDVKTLDLLAEEKGIVVTSTEMESIRRASTEFYNALSEEDRSFMGNCTVKDVTDIYVNYFLACKTAEYLLSNINSEVSDAEAKVISIQQIVVSDEESAKKLHESVTASGANFSYFARQFSENPEIDRTLYRKEEEDAYYQAAFSLEDGQISDVISQDGKFYIIKCVDSYDEKATEERKKRLEEAIRSGAFRRSYDSYAEQHIVRFREDFWKKIDLQKYPESKASNFFSLYDRYILPLVKGKG